jgi:hypothetical protein
LYLLSFFATMAARASASIAALPRFDYFQKNSMAASARLSWLKRTLLVVVPDLVAPHSPGRGARRPPDLIHGRSPERVLKKQRQSCVSMPRLHATDDRHHKVRMHSDCVFNELFPAEQYDLHCLLLSNLEVGRGGLVLRAMSFC